MNQFNRIADATAHGSKDHDAQELEEWCEALQSLVAHSGPERARQILDAVAHIARDPAIGWQPVHGTPYVNTIPVEQQPAFPGDLALEERLVSLMRWNALAMVVRANTAYGELGGHIASYASAADLFEAGFNHFFRAGDGAFGGDMVFYQPHSAPGVYARAYLEGRLTERDLEHYRQEVTAARAGARGLSSYPHPWLMPDFWQFPTGSMGIGPISSVYQARFMRYLQHRGLKDTAERKVWRVFGDGEMDEPESMSALTLAAREGLDNLVWVVNCNLQRLDGPVWGNGQIIDELEALFSGAGWNVIKLVWGSDWDGLFAPDSGGALVRAFADTVDGQFQTFAAKDGRYNRDHFFGQNEALSRLAEGLTDDQIDRLKRGGHDLVKIYAAYAVARRHQGRPTVVLAQIKKGFGMGETRQGKEMSTTMAFVRMMATLLKDHALGPRVVPIVADEARTRHIADCLDGDVPVIAATDYVRAVPQLIASYMAPSYSVLGTDGFGRSDTRSALRRFFEVDRHHITIAALYSLVRQGVIAADTCAAAIARYGVDADALASWEC